MKDRNFNLGFIPHYLFRFHRLLMKDGPEMEGLNRSQKRTLMLLRRKGSQPMTGIVQHMNIEKGSMTTVVDNLIEKGLARRERDMDDRRRVIISLTAEGIRTGAELENKLCAHIDERLDELGPDKKEAVLEAVELFQSCIERWEKQDG
jgi:DNA-binding MarR family transcriptional regulator